MNIKFLNCSIVLFSLAGFAFSAPSVATERSPFDTDEASLTQKQLIGKRLFEDANLSEPAGVSCASCHAASQAFQGNNGSRIPAVAKGSQDGKFGTRNVPTAAYAMMSPSFHFSKEKNEDGEIEWKALGGQFLDGRASNLRQQAEGPFLNAKEMNNASKKVVVDKVRLASYAPLLKNAYGRHVFDNPDKAMFVITSAIAAFEKTHAFAPFSSKFDRVLKGKDTFTPEEAKGFELFKDPQKGNCIACHVGDQKSTNPRDWLFTDYSYDNLGLPRNPDIPENANADSFDLGLCNQDGIAKKAPKGLDIDALCGAFKVPTLRDIALTPPYGHNGVFKTLRDIVKFYATRDTSPEEWYPKNADGTVNKFNDLPSRYAANVNTKEVPLDRKAGEQPRLNDQEVDAIVAFLNTLTDEK